MFKQIALAACVIAPVVMASASSTSRAAVVPFPVSAGGTGNGYELMLDSASDQNAAQNAASSAGGHLVTITSASEQSFVESLLSGGNAPTGSYWIGLDRVGSSNNFAWETGEPFSFSHFAGGEPNNYPGNENGGTIYWSQSASEPGFARRGSWNDAPVAGFPAGSLPDDLPRAGFIIEVEGAGSGNGGNPPPAVPLPPALLAAPIGMLVAGLASRRRRV
jgi:hypothetical protein